MARTIILHYHLFKNAGTSLDQILKRNFGSRWVTREFPMAGDDNSAQLAEWIRSEPEAVAFSTHTGIGPVPEVEGVDIVSVMLLRDPVARIRSKLRSHSRRSTWMPGETQSSGPPAPQLSSTLIRSTAMM